MEDVSLNTTLEEGEIIDDLEDVSDCSMSSVSLFHSGKSVSPPEHLSAVCLSSISASDHSTTGILTSTANLNGHLHYTHHGKREARRRSFTRRRNSGNSVPRHRNYKSFKRKNTTPDSDSEPEGVDPKYARKLQVALRRESSKELLHNSLKTRLKAFIDHDSQSDDEVNLAALRDLAFSTIKDKLNTTSFEPVITNSNDEIDNTNQEDNYISGIETPETPEIPIMEVDNEDSIKKTGNISNINKKIGDSIDDSELRELRLAALKTVIMEKHKRRKKKASTGKVYDEDQVSKSDSNDVNKENDKSIINNDLDDKKSTNNDEIIDKECKTNESDTNGNLAINDSRSDHTVNLDMEDDADILRAMLLASMSKKLAGNIPVENISLSGSIRKVEKSKTNINSLTVTVKKPRPLLRTIKNDIYRAVNNKYSNNFKIGKINGHHYFVKPLIINVNDDSDSDIDIGDNENNTLNDTVSEFLKKQRAEVEANNVQVVDKSTTSLKSEDASTEKSVVKLLPHSQQLEYRRLKQLLNARKKGRPRRKVSESKKEKVDTPINNSNNSATKNAIGNSNNLEQTLNEIQTTKNGRLQMKGKYQSLGPLLSRINRISNERQHHEFEIKRLLKQIEQARVKLAASHAEFTKFVRLLLQKKNHIDKGFPQSSFITSTPNKLIKKCPAPLKSSEPENSAVITTEVMNLVTGCSEEDTGKENQDKQQVESVNPDNTTIPKNDEVLVDRNDVKVFIEESTFPKYISPLYNRESIDPLTTLCPYDLLGVCKDSECPYMHCS